MNYLQRFQEIHGLVPDSVIGKKTAKALMEVLEIDSVERFCLYFGQAILESQNFNYFRENLNYSGVQLLKTWPKRFNRVTAEQYARRPYAIGNKVYGGRMGNRPGDENSPLNDGYFYRGGLAIQITGKDNWQAFFRFIGKPVTTNPQDLILDVNNYFKSITFYAKRSGMDKLSTVITPQNILNYSRLVNLGTIHTTSMPIHADVRQAKTLQLHNNIAQLTKTN